MQIVRPIAITDANLTSIDLTEDDEPPYDSGTTYALGDRVISVATHRIYESLQGSNIGHPVPVSPATETDWWINVGATNIWKMFDGGVATQTVAIDGFEVVLTPGRIDSLALLNLEASTYQAVLTSGVDVVYDSGVVSVEATQVGDWYEYFYEPIVNISDIVLTNIPQYADGVLTVTIAAPGSVAKLGMLIVGTFRDIGVLQVRPRVSIKDYSVKTTDQWGNVTVTQGDFSKRMSAEVAVTNVLIDEMVRLLTAYRAVPVVWVGTTEYTSTIIFGFFAAFEFVIEHVSEPPMSLYSLSVEGLT